jgi:hypothetical protein
VTRNEARTQHVANLLAGGTGLAFLWLKYFARSADPYSSAGHPWESVAQSAHVLLSPLLLFSVGLIWASHVWRKISRHRNRRRRSGVMIATLFAPMAISAYLIQISVDDGWRKAWVAVHLVASTLWILGYLVHLMTKPAK